MRKIYLALIVCSLALSDLWAADTASLLAPYPGKNQQRVNAANAAIVAAGPEAIVSLCKMLVPYKPQEDIKVRYALNGVARYVTRPGAENERTLVAESLCKALPKLDNFATKRFVIVLLERCGRDESIETLASFFADKKLCEPAIHALVSMNNATADQWMADALKSSSGQCRVRLIHALGERRFPPAATILLAIAGSKFSAAEERDASLAALANMGIAAAAPLIAQNLHDKQKFTTAAAQLQRLADRLAARGNKSDAAEIYRKLLQLKCDDRHLQSGILAAAATGLVGASGDAAADALLTIIPNADFALLDKLADLAEQLDDYAAVYIALSDCDIYFQYRMLSFEARNGNVDARLTLLKALASDAVNRDRIYSLTRMLDKSLVADTLMAMCSEQAIHNQTIVWLEEFPNKTIYPKMRAGWDTATIEQKTAYIAIIGHRHAQEFEKELLGELDHKSSARVRSAAIDALGVIGSTKAIAKMAESYHSAESSAERRKTLRVIAQFCKQSGDTAPLISLMTTPGAGKEVFPYLASVGGRQALDKTIKELGSSDPVIKDAAIRALLKWKTPDAIPHLLQLAGQTQELKYNALAISSIRRLGLINKKLADLQALAKAFSIAKRPQEKTALQSAMFSIMADKHFGRRPATNAENVIKSAYAVLTDTQKAKLKSKFKGIVQ